MGEKRGGSKLVIVVVISVLVLLLALGYFSILYSKKVDSQTEFNSRLYNCERTVYLSDQKDVVWHYEILGKKNEECKVRVSLISVKEGDVGLKKLEGNSMICNLPLRSVNSPESNLKICHGLLKEGIQEIIIKRMHEYVTTNLDDIKSVL